MNLREILFDRNRNANGGDHPHHRPPLASPRRRRPTPLSFPRCPRPPRDLRPPAPAGGIPEENLLPGCHHHRRFFLLVAVGGGGGGGGAGQDRAEGPGEGAAEGLPRPQGPRSGFERDGGGDQAVRGVVEGEADLRQSPLQGRIPPRRRGPAEARQVLRPP